MVLPETRSKLVYCESEEDLRTYTDFAKCLLISLATYQASNLAHFPFILKAFPQQHHLSAITGFNTLTLIK